MVGLVGWLVGWLGYVGMVPKESFFDWLRLGRPDAAAMPVVPLPTSTVGGPSAKVMSKWS